MSALKKFLFPALLVLAGLQGQANAFVLTFDDITPDSETPMNNDYGDLDWGNFFVVDSNANVYSNTGYAAGTVSGTQVALNGWAQTASISNTALWTFDGAYLTAAWSNNLQVEVIGQKAGSTLFSKTVTVNTTSAAWFDFDFAGIDTLVFNSSVDGFASHFVMDNFTYNIFQEACDAQTEPNCEPSSEVPEPSSIALVAIGLAGLMMARRRHQA